MVTELHIYPVKSLAGISLPSAMVSDRGLKYDRRWMLVDDQNCFISQRECAQMALLKVSIEGEMLVFRNTDPSSSPLAIPLDPTVMSTRTQMVQIWSDRCRALFLSEEADKWFSEALSISCRLVYMPEETHRRVDGRYARNKEITSFTDGYPFLIVGQQSLDDLNNRLTDPVPMNRFRPNIVFSGGSAYQEDAMDHFTIGGIHFFGVKPSARCVITTINQQTAKMSKEPLKTLATYRKKRQGVYFGQNLLSEGNGTIHVGDVILELSNLAV